MQRLRTRGATAAGETKRRATQQSPRNQTIMMACHFTAERCADTLIPTLSWFHQQICYMGRCMAVCGMG
jgi:hypothetical protein